MNTPLVEPIIYRDFDNAESFLSALRGSAREWGEGWLSDWVFRGHGDSAWKLIPAACRNNPSIELVQNYYRNWVNSEFIKEQSAIPSTMKPEYIIDVLLLQAAESELVQLFAEAARDAGLPTPALDTLRTASYIVQNPKNWDWHWVSEREVEIFALAQHHGVPTRLLDWTRHPWTAAFFAAQECFNHVQGLTKGERRSQRIAVWALNERRLQERDEINRYHPNRAENAYLRAQDGLFTFDRGAMSTYMNHGFWPALEDRLAHRLEDYPVLQKLTLSAQHVPELLRLLYREKMTPHFLMPSYRSAAEMSSLIYRWDKQTGNPDW